jgi:hypothetical protein
MGYNKDIYTTNDLWDKLLGEIKRKEVIINLKDFKKTRLINIIRSKNSKIDAQNNIINGLKMECSWMDSEIKRLNNYINHT